MNAEELDGRRLRRDRNREAVVEALLALHAEGDLRPGVQRIAERSGVSHRSVFRYFQDVDDLTRVAMERQLQRISPLLRIHGYAHGTTDERVDALVEQRLALYDAMGNTAVVARMRGPLEPLVADQLRQLWAFLREQLVGQLAPELARLDPDEAARRVDAAAALSSFESYRLLLDAGLDAVAVGAVWRSGLRALVAVPVGGGATPPA